MGVQSFAKVIEGRTLVSPSGGRPQCGRSEHDRFLSLEDMLVHQRPHVEGGGVQGEAILEEFGPVDHALVRLGDESIQVGPGVFEIASQAEQRQTQILSVFYIVGV